MSENLWDGVLWGSKDRKTWTILARGQFILSSHQNDFPYLIVTDPPLYDNSMEVTLDIQSSRIRIVTRFEKESNNA